ncbi:unnamed protein product, partial [Thlaspi arvense]
GCPLEHRWQSTPDENSLASKFTVQRVDTALQLSKSSQSTKEAEHQPHESDSEQNWLDLGCFTEEKTKWLRLMTMEGSSFHDAMYHSVIAS